MQKTVWAVGKVVTQPADPEPEFSPLRSRKLSFVRNQDSVTRCPVIAAIVYWNTSYIDKAVNHLAESHG